MEKSEVLENILIYGPDTINDGIGFDGIKAYGTKNESDYEQLLNDLKYRILNKILIIGHGSEFNKDSMSIDLGFPITPSQLVKNLKENNIEFKLIDISSCHIGIGIERIKNSSEENKKNLYELYNDNLKPGTAIILNGGNKPTYQNYGYFIEQSVDDKSIYQSFLNKIINPGELIDSETKKIIVKTLDGELLAYKYSAPKPKNTDEASTKSIKFFLKEKVKEFSDWWKKSGLEKEIISENDSHTKKIMEIIEEEHFLEKYQEQAKWLEEKRGKTKYSKLYQAAQLDRNDENNLYIAVLDGNLNDVESFLNKKVNPNTIVNNSETPLLIAIERCCNEDPINDSSLKILKFLLDGGVNPNQIGGDTKYTPLCLALLHDKIEIAELLLNKGAESYFNWHG